MFSKIIDKIYSSVSSIPFDTLVWVIIGSFAAITVFTVIMCFAVAKIRAAEKRPYLCLVNAYTAVVLSAFLTREPLAQSALAAVIFWCFGYFLYGVLCFISKPQKAENATPSVVTMLPARNPVAAAPRPDVPAAKSSVRLEHAMSVTERLLQKNLGKSDRQELEKLKSTLSVLQMKGELSPAESDILNDNFNALLKLMAKYNI
ncbi:MAG: hypothetical protein K2N23_07045 [Clostridia bacterium]|nr:hypothetical protein [Clostridia bacterium]